MMVIGASAETVPSGMTGGLNATSICVIRREPWLTPNAGVTAREVSIQTGVIGCAGFAVAQVVPTGIVTSCCPFQQTCNPGCRNGEVPSTVWGGFSKPIRFCLLVILTHLKGSALLLPVFGTWTWVKAGFGNW